MDFWTVAGSIGSIVGGISVFVAVVIYFRQRGDHEREVEQGRRAMLDNLRGELSNLCIEQFAQVSIHNPKTFGTFDPVRLVVPQQLVAASILDYATDGPLVSALVDLERCIESYNSLILTATSHILTAAVLEAGNKATTPTAVVVEDITVRATERAKAIVEARSKVLDILPIEH